MAKKIPIYMSHEKMSKDRMERVLKEKHETHTLSEMAKITGWAYISLQKRCEQLGLPTITNGERIEKTILANPDFTFEEMMVVTDISSVALKAYLKKLGVILKRGHKVIPEQAESLIDSIERATRKENLGKRGLLGPIASRYFQDHGETSLLGLSNKLRHGV